MNRKQTIKKTFAYTLVELLVTIVIIAILSVISISALLIGYSKTRDIVCKNNLKQLSIAMSAYGDDYNSKLPAAHGWLTWTNTEPIMAWTRALKEYYINTNILTCPSFSKIERLNKINYFMNGWTASVDTELFVATNLIISKVMYPSELLLSGDVNHPIFHPDDADPDNYAFDTLFSRKSPTHKGKVNILFTDGNVNNFKTFDSRLITLSYNKKGKKWEKPKKHVYAFGIK